MSSLINLSPHDKTLYRPGSKIFFTVGNKHKVLESILFQVFTSISPPFQQVSMLLKNWICNLNDHSSKKIITDQAASVKVKPQFKWVSVNFLLIHYMQTNHLLPVLTDTEIEKLYQHLLWDTQFIQTSFHYSKPMFYFLKLPQDCLERIKSIHRFLNRPRRSVNAGQILIEFLRFIVHDLSDSRHPSRQEPIRVVNRVDVQVKPSNPVRKNFIFWVQSLFSDQMLSMMSCNLKPDMWRMKPQENRQLFMLEKFLLEKFETLLKEYEVLLDKK